MRSYWDGVYKNRFAFTVYVKHGAAQDVQDSGVWDRSPEVRGLMQQHGFTHMGVPDNRKWGSSPLEAMIDDAVELLSSADLQLAQRAAASGDKHELKEIAMRCPRVRLIMNESSPCVGSMSMAWAISKVRETVPLYTPFIHPLSIDKKKIQTPRRNGILEIPAQLFTPAGDNMRSSMYAY